ncbi:MAG: aminomethyl-transferring glycine dehydrogenase [Candidatus Kapabacteria bacterium]|nr:aminomethyl-transferring glycine dehydrogenase [Candidatus Kapabacteria bacterium]
MSNSCQSFAQRHIGPRSAEIDQMLATVGFSSLEEFTRAVVPSDIRLNAQLELPPPLSEHEVLARLRHLAGRNKLYRSFIGMGYYGTITPPVIQRNILENPGWYTPYTPYQSEIAQGRLEALLTFQTMVSDLTGMEISNASLLDEATAVAEAVHMMFSIAGHTSTRNVVYADDTLFPQTIAVLQTRCNAVGIELRIAPWQQWKFDDQLIGGIVQYPNGYGAIEDYRELAERIHQHGGLLCVATDLLALCLLEPPGAWGADIVVGSAQRFGVPLGYGGPHAAYLASHQRYIRYMPGRIIGVSIDAEGNPAYRMTLQTREQHIKRDKATSNICTAQALLANVAAMYAVYHGPHGLRCIAERVHRYTVQLDALLRAMKIEQENVLYFDTLRIPLTFEQQAAVRTEALRRQINLRYFADGAVGISLDETTTEEDVTDLAAIFATALHRSLPNGNHTSLDSSYPSPFARTTPYLQHPVFNSYHSETEMMRYLKRLENKDLSLVHAMIPLGSCTMKLNAAVEMMPITWPEFNQLHPFVPLDQAEGYQELLRELEQYLATITGLDAVSLQPNSGAQGEYTGLLVIRAYHRSRGEDQRRIALIPASAHGTNPASAVMAGLQVVVIASDERGYIDRNDLERKLAEYGDRIACLMVTYPSTHGVFEEHIRSICQRIHDVGGLVYMDGANLNAQVGLTSPGAIGADVCHINLHKTFCIPHGGGGPGMGPIAVRKELAPFLPVHPVVPMGERPQSVGTVSAAPWGSASILPISWAYIRLMGAEGLRTASQLALLAANYLKARLQHAYPILYVSATGHVAHEMILDVRPFRQRAGVDAEDIAKRLIDYGFHAPTVSFPVPGTLMIEPTESESLAELDRFCEAMLAIRAEIAEIEQGQADRTDNVLKNAPHTAQMIASDTWSHPYSRQKAAFPLPFVRERKFWPAVARVNNTYGDRNIVCTCPPVEAYAQP